MHGRFELKRRLTAGESLTAEHSARVASAHELSTACNCGGHVDLVADFGMSPLANAYPTDQDRFNGETVYPLALGVCQDCDLLQLRHALEPEILFPADYAYRTSISSSAVAHARASADALISRFALGPDSLVIEAASNDGYMLHRFVERGVPCLGVEPAAGAAEVARGRGVPTEVAFLDPAVAEGLRVRGYAADLLPANNVLAHVPDLRGFLRAVQILLKPQGVASFEFPTAMRLLEDGLIDTIYHEHYSYLLLGPVEAALDDVGLRAFDVELLPTHGGSLRLFVCRSDADWTETEALMLERAAEEAAPHPSRLLMKASKIRRDLVTFLLDSQSQGLTVAAYGAAAKATTLFNYCGVGPDLVSFCADLSPTKHGRFIPGTGVPIVGLDDFMAGRPDRVLIIPWNIRDEICETLRPLTAWNGQAFVALPEFERVL